jgi:hypothetical protein
MLGINRVIVLAFLTQDFMFRTSPRQLPILLSVLDATVTFGAITGVFRFTLP